MKIIYVHGFGERRFPPGFENKMNGFIAEHQAPIEIETYRWDSYEIDFTQVVHQWHEAKKNADQEARTFAVQIFDKYESQKQPYLVVAYSLGCRVVAEAMALSSQEPIFLQGIIFMGAALPKNYQLKKGLFPAGFQIQSYYSATFDTVLKVSFYNAEGIDAGGEKGFDDTHCFNNYKTVSTHVHKGGPVQRDYSEMSEALALLVLFKTKVNWNDDSRHISFWNRVGKGQVHWNDLLQVPRSDKKLLFQQNVNTGHFRVVGFKENGKRSRLSWNNNLHTLLTEFQIKPEEIF